MANLILDLKISSNRNISPQLEIENSNKYALQINNEILHKRENRSQNSTYSTKNKFSGIGKTILP